jgi:hypothetical protein
MSSSAVAQQAGSTAGCDPAPPIDPARPRPGVPGRIATDTTVLGAGAHCRRYRPAGRRHRPIDTGISPGGFRGIVCAAAPTGARP